WRGAWGSSPSTSRRGSAAGTPTRTISAPCATPACPRPTRPSRRCSKTSTRAGSSTRLWSCGPASSAGRPGSTATPAVTTGPTAIRCCWPAAGLSAGTSTAHPTPREPFPGTPRAHPMTSRRRCSIAWASTPPPYSATSSTARYRSLTGHRSPRSSPEGALNRSFGGSATRSFPTGAFGEGFEPGLRRLGPREPLAEAFVSPCTPPSIMAAVAQSSEGLIRLSHPASSAGPDGDAPRGRLRWRAARVPAPAPPPAPRRLAGVETSEGGSMDRSDADRGLLFGILALQNGMVEPVDLIAAFQLWSRDRTRPLGRVLLERGALDERGRALVEDLV